MTYSTEKKRAGRETCVIVDAVLDYCQLSYGSAPCTASVGVTGDRKCFNTRANCQDPDNYDRGTKSYFFGRAGDNLPPELGVIPSLTGYNLAPTQISPPGMGTRASVSLTFADHAHHDRGIDKYVGERDYNPMKQGSFWGKFRARNPFYQGRKIKIHTGFITTPFSWDNFETREYVIEKIDGPDGSDQVNITAKDPLKSADDDRSLCPAPSTGRLSADIEVDTLNFTLEPSGVGSEEYPATGTLKIGSECMTFTRSGDVFTVTRGTDRTEAAEHKGESSAQLCYRVTDEPAQNVLHDLLVDFAGIDTSLIDFPTWDNEGETWLSRHLLNALVTDPTGVRKLVTEIAEQCMIYLWWDERAQTIKMRALAPPGDAVQVLTDDANLELGSVSVGDDPGRRASRVIAHFNIDDPTGSPSDKNNYQEQASDRDADAEGVDKYGSARVRDIMCRWFNGGNRGQAYVLTVRTLHRLRNNPRRFRFAMDAKDGGISAGDVVDIVTARAQDETGAPATLRCQILSVREPEAGTRYEYLAEEFFFQGRYWWFGPNDLPSYGDATDAQKDKYSWIAPNAGVFANGDPSYKVI